MIVSMAELLQDARARQYAVAMPIAWNHESTQAVIRAAEEMRSPVIMGAGYKPAVVGSEQGGLRPVLVVQNNKGNRYSPTVIVAAITAARGECVSSAASMAARMAISLLAPTAGTPYLPA